MKPSLTALSFMDTIARVSLGEHQLHAMVHECVQLWQGSSSPDERQRAERLQERWQSDPTFETLMKNVTLEAIAVSGLLVTLRPEEDIPTAIASLPRYAHDLELAALKREIASRGIQINRRLSKLTKLPWPVVQQRLTDYLAH